MTHRQLLLIESAQRWRTSPPGIDDPSQIGIVVGDRAIRIRAVIAPFWKCTGFCTACFRKGGFYLGLGTVSSPVSAV